MVLKKMAFRLPLHWVCDFSTEVAGLPLGIETKILPPGRLQCKARPEGTAHTMFNILLPIIAITLNSSRFCGFLRPRK